MNTGQTCQLNEDNVRAWPRISFSWTVTTTDIVNFHQPFQPGHEITISGSLGTTLCPLHLGTWADCRRAGLSFSLTPLPHPPLARTTFTVVIGSNQYGLVLSPVDFQSCGSFSRPRCGSGCQGTWRSPLQDCEMEHLPIPIPVRISSNWEPRWPSSPCPGTRVKHSTSAPSTDPPTELPGAKLPRGSTKTAKLIASHKTRLSAGEQFLSLEIRTL